MRDILHKSYLLGGDFGCPRIDCTTCQTEDMGIGTCTDTNVVYETICMICKSQGKDACYVGETHKSIYLRMKEHVNDYPNLSKTSHMRVHHEVCHPDIKDRKLLHQEDLLP